MVEGRVDAKPEAPGTVLLNSMRNIRARIDWISVYHGGVEEGHFKVDEGGICAEYAPGVEEIHDNGAVKVEDGLGRRVNRDKEVEVARSAGEFDNLRHACSTVAATGGIKLTTFRNGGHARVAPPMATEITVYDGPVGSRYVYIDIVWTPVDPPDDDP